MKPNIHDIREKKARKNLAQVQLKASAAHAKQRFAPSNLAAEAKENAEEAADIIVKEGMEIAKNNKWPLAGVAIAAALLLARKPIQEAIENLREAE